MKTRILFTICFVISIASFGCGNEYGHTLDGRKLFSRWFTLPNRVRSHDTTRVLYKIEVAKRKIQADSTDFRAWSDLSWNYMKIGKVDTAMKILKPLVIKYPNEYNITANLGTGYELQGKLDSALKYIQKGIKIKKTSHFGSEWIHAEILKAKIKNKKSPGWLHKHEILPEKVFLAHVDTSKRFGLEIMDRLVSTQLRTRAAFTPAPNMVIYNICLSMGNHHFKYGTYENAFLYYAYAREFVANTCSKDKVYRKIEELNKKRLANTELKSLPRMFIQTIQRGRLDPNLLYVGLSSFANEQDSIDLREIEVQDSIKILSGQIDSLKQAHENMSNQTPKVETVVKKEINWIWTISIASLLAMAFFIIGRRNRKS